MDASQYAELFLAESREHLSSFNQLLLEWERDPEAEHPLGGIFRAVHTLKGMAATMGYARVADLAHRVENLLDLIRRRERAVTDEVLELLFRTADVLERGVEASVAGRGDDVNTAAVAAALDRAVGGAEPAERGRRAAPPAAPPAGAGRAVRVLLDVHTPLKGARALLVLRRLEALGRVYGVEPPIVTFEHEEFDGRFACRVDSAAPDDAIAAAVRGVGDVADVAIGTADAARDEAAAARARHIRVDLRRLDALMDLIGELVTARGRLQGLSAQQADPDLEDVAAKMTQLSGELQTEIIQARMTPVWQVFDRFPRVVRDLARQLGKQVAFHVEGKDIELDRAILDEIGDPLLHLLRNAVDHGIESPEERAARDKPPGGTIQLSAVRERAAVAIRVRDDGRGIDRRKILASAKARGVLEAEVEELSDEELLRILARPGFSTAAQVSEVSGRGVGIDVVVERLRGLGGGVEIRSTPGEGTTFTLRLPPTLAIVRALLTRVGEERYALPITHVAESLDLERAPVTRVDGREALTLRDQIVPLVHLRDVLGVDGAPPPRRPVIVLEIGERRAGLVVDALLGQQEIVVKGFDAPRGTVPVFGGATILPDGRAALILDASGLV